MTSVSNAGAACLDRRGHLMDSDPSGRGSAVVHQSSSIPPRKITNFLCLAAALTENRSVGNYVDRSDILCLNDYLHRWRRRRCRIQMLVCNSLEKGCRKRLVMCTTSCPPLPVWGYRGSQTGINQKHKLSRFHLLSSSLVLQTTSI